MDKLSYSHFVLPGCIVPTRESRDMRREQESVQGWNSRDLIERPSPVLVESRLGKDGTL